jgi:fructokinase
VTLDQNGHQFHIPPNQAWDAIDASAALKAMHQSPPQVLCFGTLAQRAEPSRTAIQQAAQAVKATGGRVVLDLNLRDVPINQKLAAQSLPLAHALKVNEDELRQLMHWFVSDEAAHAAWGSALHDQATASLASQFALELIVVTRGADGYAAYVSGQRACEGASPPLTQLIDTVGAGDAFLSVLLLGEQFNWPLPTTLERAATFATAICGVRGAVPQHKSFYAPWVQQWSLADAAVRATKGAATTIH